MCFSYRETKPELIRYKKPLREEPLLLQMQHDGLIDGAMNGWIDGYSLTQYSDNISNLNNFGNPK